ncbi:HTH domain-containing protein [Streptomyces sp. NPDC006739]|uniref:HTH domain-containing protein n=1 Tax=Streptomyces sp. NPDC006739 TaxID=3364763 RepID=UPI0036CB9F67
MNHTARLGSMRWWKSRARQRRGRWHSRALAARFEVSTRTVQRDLQALMESGVPVRTTPERDGDDRPGDDAAPDPLHRR